MQKKTHNIWWLTRRDTRTTAPCSSIRSQDTLQMRQLTQFKFRTKHLLSQSQCAVRYVPRCRSWRPATPPPCQGRAPSYARRGATHALQFHAPRCEAIILCKCGNWLNLNLEPNRKTYSSKVKVRFVMPPDAVVDDLQLLRRAEVEPRHVRDAARHARHCSMLLVAQPGHFADAVGRREKLARRRVVDHGALELTW